MSYILCPHGNCMDMSTEPPSAQGVVIYVPRSPLIPLTQAKLAIKEFIVPLFRLLCPPMASWTWAMTQGRALW
jgi:hypothetical protein